MIFPVLLLFSRKDEKSHLAVFHVNIRLCIHSQCLTSILCTIQCSRTFPYEVRATFRDSKRTELCAVFNGRSTLLPAVLYIDLSLMPVTALCLSRFSQKAFGGTTALHY